MEDNSNDILFEKFHIIECLKKDVGAAVYLANHIYLGKPILLKTLDRDHIPDPAMLSRFQREAKTLAKLDHPNIIKVLDFGMHERFFYISFEFFKSRTLRDVVKSGSLSDSDKKHVLVQLFRGLDYAHARNVVHRDIKPENILLDDNNVLKIADFGLAQIYGEESFTQQTTIVGTPSYMSPEQISGKTLTSRSDLFSAGVVAYELITGENPFLGNDVGATLNNIFAKDVRLMDEQCADASMRDLVNFLLKKKENERLNSAAEALKSLGEGSKISAPLADEIDEPRGRRGIFVGVLSLFLMISLAIFWMINRQKTESVDAEFVSDSAHDSLVTSTALDSGIAMHETTLTEALPREPHEKTTAPEVITKLVQNTAPGRLHINCLPWAHVYIDDTKRNTTPLEDAIELLPGDYHVRLEHPNYPAFVQNIRIEAEKDYYINATLYSYLSCNIYPWGDVYVDNQALGQTPFAEAVTISPGTHVLLVKNQQYGQVEKNFTIVAGDTFFFTLNFESPSQVLN